MRASRWLGAALLTAHVARCRVRARPPQATSLAERLDMIPKQGWPVTDRVDIRWNEHQVPFIEAAADADLAVALGLVHAHLRLGQMELLRRIALGRLAELLGPVAADIDHALRSLCLELPVPAILAGMPTETRRWLDGFTAGINHYLMHCAALPEEFAILGLRREPWSAADVVTLGRLAAADVTWLVWLRGLGAGGESPRRHRLLRTLRQWTRVPAVLPRLAPGMALAQLFAPTGRRGSNALAVASARSASGAALLAGDPHLGLTLPNLWLIAGYRSPSHHAVGLMLPGLPFLAIGRNRNIAWGGANLHAASSELSDVSSLSPGAIRTREETITIRWWRSRRIRIRETDFGPIISDTPLLRRKAPGGIALRWRGQDPSDESTAMLRASRASNWAEFAAALDGFAVPGIQMLYADRNGHVGRRMAVQLPRRSGEDPWHILSPADCADWARLLSGKDLPQRFDPPQGYVVAANEQPEACGTLIGWFFSSGDRYRRLCRLVEQDGRSSVATVRRMLRDVRHEPSLPLRDHLLHSAASAGLDGNGDGLLAALRDWDGSYAAGSRGALAFELVVHALARRLIEPQRLAGYDALWQSRAFLTRDLTQLPPERLAAALRPATAEATRRFRRFGTWGTMHRLQLNHFLHLLPMAGRRYRYGDFAVDGSNETVMKTAHPLTNRRHATNYGSNARYIFDLSDPDANDLVLLGGQDGWHGSATAGDQWPLWQRGDYVRVPLEPETVRARFRYCTVLAPGSAGTSP